MEESTLIYTNENCIGCNKCIGVCPSLGANSSIVDSKGHSRILVDADRCIACGACLQVCEHHAREFGDDTNRFFNDLNVGKAITLLVDHSFLANYAESYRKILYHLKKLGVKQILPVSFGADITTWAYINYIERYNFTGGIAQPCPSVVGYIEKYLPEMLPNLMPIHSPLMCSAIYAKKYMGIEDSLAYLSPCVAKKHEIEDKNCKGYVEYNVTYERLTEYLADHEILDGEEAEGNLIEPLDFGLGCGYPMAGGLKESIQWFLGDEAFVRQMDGQNNIYKYLKKNKNIFTKNKMDYLFLDAMNCSGGCLSGTACEKSSIENEEAVMTLQEIKRSVKTHATGSPWSMMTTREARLDALNKRFETLDLADFVRRYTDRSQEMQCKALTKEEEDRLFLLLKKDTIEKRSINCGRCGYESCKAMVRAMHNGFNHKENCVNYTKDLAIELADNLATELIAKNYKDRHDVVTGLYNAEEFFKQVRVELKDNRDKVYFMLALDMRQFKLINDLYGYDQGNRVLKCQADLMRKVLTDEAIFGRISGDKFGICIEMGIYDRIILVDQFTALEREIAKLGINVFLQAGICLIEDHDIDPVMLFDRAVMAVNTIKTSYTQKIAYYCEDMRNKSIRSQRMVSEFEEALSNSEFQIYVQPQFSATNEHVGGGEVLVRWIHPEKGVVAPGYFIPVFEECGLISKLDYYVWKKTCEKLREWKDRGRDNLYLSVNISPYDLGSMNIYDVMTGLVEKYEISPHNLKLEITETAVMSDLNTQLVLIDKLKKYGFTVEMDDFGSGYSSLNMLKDINVNTLKIDMMFLSNTQNTEKSDIILKTIIMLSKQLGLNVITEGVETEEQVAFLRNSGSDVFQGYFYAKPMPIDEFDLKYAS